MTARRRLAGLGLALLAAPLACSTLASPEPASVCTNDDDCDKSLGQICGAGTCYASNLPPRAEVAIDMTAAGGGGGSFRLELFGPDHAVTRIDTRPTRYHVGLDNDDAIAGVRDELRLAVLETYHFGDQDAVIPLRATLYPSQGSRLGIAPPKSVLSLRLDPLDAMDQPLDPLPVAVLPWAHYDSNDRSPSYTAPGPETERPLLVQISPDDGLDLNLNVDVQRGIVYRQLVREQQSQSSTHAFNLHTDRDCHRNLYGTARIVGEQTDAPSPVPIGVELFHIRRDPAPGAICDPEPAIGTPAVCSPATIARVSDYKPVPCTAKSQCPQPLGCYPTAADDGSRACGCGSDSECPSGQVCELQSRRCALDLASPDIGVAGYGLQASEGGLVTANVEKPGGTVSEFEAWVYTYCEDDPEADREMEFIVRATPNALANDPQAPLPQLTYHTSVDFVWDNGDRPRATLKNMCFPDWKPPQPLTFDVTSAPRELYRDATDQPFVCCSAACLASPASPPPESCRLIAALTARTIFTPDAQLWSDRGCMALDSPDPTVPEGSQRLSYNFDLSACTAGPCNVSLSPGTTSLEYELRVEPPASSLIRSMIVPSVIIDPTTTSLTLPKLEYRVLLRGRVTAEDCGEGSLTIDCPRASILAERLRIPGEEPALSPIFPGTTTIPGSNGDFVLAVNPGVYLLTALPASGSPGGPADIRVVDLRLDSKLVDTSGPIPIADLDAPLALDVGKLVTVELEGFGRSTKAVPFDVGYWANPKPTLNGEPLDLNNPATCYGSTNRGCQIRRLRATGSFLSLTQESYVKYLARGTESP